MAPRRRRLAEFRLLEGDDTGQTDTCALADDEIYNECPKEERLSLIGRDFQWAEAAIEPSIERKGAFYVYKWGAKYTDGDDFVDVWSHGRLLVSVRRLGYGDGEITYVTKSSRPESKHLHFLRSCASAKLPCIDASFLLVRIGTTDVKHILEAINKKETFRGESNVAKRFPIFSGTMTYLGPNERDVDLEWIVRLDEVHDQSRTGTSGGDMDEIVVRET